MQLPTLLVALGGLAAIAQGSVIQRPDRIVARQGNRGKNNANTGNNNNGNNNAAAASTCLNANAVATGSAQTGAKGASAGQANSATDTANFINFCSGQTLTNGLQVKAGSCNGIVMGKIPATSNMVSSVITNPKLNDNLNSNTDFNVTVNIANLNLGTFTNPDSTYYSAPQDLKGGSIVGHTHVTIQNVGNSFQFTSPLDAQQFVFFKGINDAGNGRGTVTTAVTGGLPAGNYRVCTMSASSNHQPVLMPVAQRGAQDDCRYFTVGGNGNNANNNAANNNNAKAGTGTTGNAKTTTSAAAAATSAAKGKGNNNKAAAAAADTTASAATGGALGGIAAPAVQDSGDAARPFSVNGDTFVNKAVAQQRACAIQNNACATAVNSGTLTGSTVNDCNAQQQACNAAAAA